MTTQNAKTHVKMPRRNVQKNKSAPAEILVVAIKETPERVIDKMRSRRYPKNWRGMLPSKLAEEWKAKGYVRFVVEARKDGDSGDDGAALKGDGSSAQDDDGSVENAGDNS